MTTNWVVAVDWDRDGVFCKHARLGDNLNVYPKPAVVNQIKYDAVTHVGVALGWSTVRASSELVLEPTDYGLYVIRTTTNSHSESGLWLGRDAGGVDDILVITGTPKIYTVVYWIRAGAGAEGQSFATRVLDQSGEIDALSSTYTLTSTWQRRTLTFETESTSTHINIRILRATPTPTTLTFDVAGVMLVEGNVAPEGFNAGNYSNFYDALPVISANWFLGNRTSYQDIADNSMLEVVFENSDKRFSPENLFFPLLEPGTARSLVAPFRPILVESNSDGIQRKHWVGWIETVLPDVNVHGQRRAKITASGPMQFMRAAETRLPLQENQLTSQIVAALITEVVIPPSLANTWVLDNRQYTQLNISTFLGGANSPLTDKVETGIVKLALAGDNWVRQGGLTGASEDTFNVYRAIWDVTAAERGRFFFNRAGQAVFWNRHHLLRYKPVESGASAVPVFYDTMTDLSYSYAGLDDLKNEIVVACHPRALSAASNELLWKLAEPLQIPANETRTVRVKYEDEAGNRIGGRNVAITGATFSSGYAAISVKGLANGAELIVSNSNSTFPATLATCEIRGQKITDFGTLEATISEGGSIMAYGRRSLKISLPALDDFEDARGIAIVEMIRRSQPRGMVGSMTLVSHSKEGGDQHPHQLQWTIGDAIRVIESQTSHTSLYVIVGEAHRLSQAGELWETTWYLEPTPPLYPWKLDDNEAPQPDPPATGARSRLNFTTFVSY